MVDTEVLEDFRDLAGARVLHAILFGHAASFLHASVTVEVTKVDTAPGFERFLWWWEFVFKSIIAYLLHVGGCFARHHPT